MAIALIMAVNVNAQEGYEDTKHEVGLSFGLASNSQWIDAFEDVFSDYSYENIKYVEPISAEYFYHINKVLGLGGIFVYGNTKQDVYYRWSSSWDRIGKSSNGYYTLMPAVKFNFLRKKNVGLYSKAALGVTYRTEYIDYDDKRNIQNLIIRDNKNNMRFAKLTKEKEKELFEEDQKLKKLLDEKEEKDSKFSWG